jgi:5-methylcytosine-specific restriction enzyme B
LGVGSNGFRKDLELATKPGLRRLFSQLIDNNGFAKHDFGDIESGLPLLKKSHLI